MLITTFNVKICSIGITIKGEIFLPFNSTYFVIIIKSVHYGFCFQLA